MLIKLSWREVDFRRPVAVAMMYAAACGGDSAAKHPTEPAPVPVARVVVAPSPILAFVGFPQQFTASTTDAAGRELTGRSVSWSISDTTKATVSSGGEVTGVTEGYVTVTATSEGQSGSRDVLVFRIDVDSVVVTPPTATLSIGGTQQLTAVTLSRTGLPLPGQALTWSSSDISKATVSPGGIVTAMAAGSLTITATSGAKSGSASITVAP